MYRLGKDYRHYRFVAAYGLRLLRNGRYIAVAVPGELKIALGCARAHSAAHPRVLYVVNLACGAEVCFYGGRMIGTVPSATAQGDPRAMIYPSQHARARIFGYPRGAYSIVPSH